MTKNIKKVATYCLIGTVFFSGKTLVTKAAELPVAGIDVVLNDFYLTANDENGNIANFLEPVNSEYQNLAISKVVNYVNIRKKASEKSKVVGKLYSNSAATIVDKKGDWYKVKSGSVTGYIKGEYLVTGEKVEKLAKKVGERIATVTTTTLKVREKASLKAPVVTLIPIDEELEVMKEVDGWAKVSLDSDVIGYVSSDYIKIRTEYKEAESIAEEKARLKAEEAARQNQEAGNSRETANTYNTNATTSNTKRATKKVSKASYSIPSNTSTSGNRQAIVNYALKFVGNPYVWGGTSLTNGADCSGFTQSVLRNFGISIPRVSREQAYAGRTVSLSDIQPGDLIFYTSGGSINHVAMYIGNGQVVHASSRKTGIKISNYTYRQPYKAVSYIN